MNLALYFIYDSHCPWSYAATPLVKAIVKAFPDLSLHLWHSARYEGDEQIGIKTIEQVELDSKVVFNQAYNEQRKNAADSTIAANLMAWMSAKSPDNALTLLENIQQQHFEQANSLKQVEDFNDLVEQMKLSAPKKVFNQDKYTKEAEFVLSDIEELQQIIGTQAIPALLLAVDDELILLNHNLYLKNPKAIIEAVKLELK